ncbi:MAG: class I SAM-dependent methyltransferase [Deltaproteobacteria bacterium]|nr:class I SAM-dependent methyltransferase [Deltaproteobacteria bacterium]
MEEREYEVMASVEDRHFWFVGTRGMVRDAVLAARLPRDAEVLDLGCGTGGTMKALAGLGRFTGLDTNETAARLAERRTGNRVVLGSGTSLPFGDASFDAVLALDVFEHIEDDLAAVREARRVLRPGGALVATVPCHPFLWSAHDRALHHVRRYTRPGFLAVLREGGFRVERATWTNAILFPAVAAVRLAGRAVPRHGEGAPRSDAQVRLGPLNGLLSAVFQAERRLVRRLDLPFGVSLLVVARPSR